MLPAIRYLSWMRHVWQRLGSGAIAYDLATSGVPLLSSEELRRLGAQASFAPEDFSLAGRFQEAVGRRYGVEASQVVPCLGAAGAVFALYAGLLSPGDEVLIEHPTYEPMYRVAEGLGVRVVRWQRPLSPSRSLDEGAIVELVRPRTRMVVLCNPHNPSGVCISDAEVRSLAAALQRRGAFLVVNEAYREFVHPRTSAFHLGSNVLTLSSMTKFFGLGWARSGWIIAPKAMVAALEEANTHITGTLPPALSGYGALGLDIADTLVERAHGLLRGKRALVEEFARTHEGTLSWSEPAEGMPFGFFVDRRGDDLTARIEEGALVHKVLVGPGSFFEEPAGFRISFSNSTEKLGDGLSRLPAVLGLGSSA